MICPYHILILFSTSFLSILVKYYILSYSAIDARKVVAVGTTMHHLRELVPSVNRFFALTTPGISRPPQLVDGGISRHSVYLSVPPDGCDNRALAMPTPPGPDSRLDRLPSPGRSRLPFFPDPQAQEHCQQQEQHHVCVEHSHPHPQRYHPTPSFAFSQTASLGYPSPLQEAGQPFLPSQNLHTQWPREEVGGMPHPASVGPKAVNDRSCAGAGDFRGGTQDGNCSGGVGDHTDTTLAMRPIKVRHHPVRTMFHAFSIHRVPAGRECVLEKYSFPR